MKNIEKWNLITLEEEDLVWQSLDLDKYLSTAWGDLPPISLNPVSLCTKKVTKQYKKSHKKKGATTSSIFQRVLPWVHFWRMNIWECEWWMMRWEYVANPPVSHPRRTSGPFCVASSRGLGLSRYQLQLKIQTHNVSVRSPGCCSGHSPIITASRPTADYRATTNI